MTKDLFTGNLVRLAVVDLERDPEITAKWMRDSEFMHLWSTRPAHQNGPKPEREFFASCLDRMLFFMIQTLEEDRVIGQISLADLNLTTGNAWLGIGIGDRDCWGKGYGTDAMQLLLRYVFEQVNLRRVSLEVHEYNTCGIRLYKKLGFQVEGRERGYLNRFGRRWDMIFMGLLRDEWKVKQSSTE